MIEKKRIEMKTRANAMGASTREEKRNRNREREGYLLSSLLLSAAHTD